MSAPVSDTPVSLSTSGFEDGLGRRVLVFDRATGAILERLTVRPEIAALERALHDSAARFGAMQDERIGRVKTVQREGNGRVIVDSEFSAGDRLSDLLDLAADGRDDTAAPGVDIAIGFLLKILPAIGMVHTIGGCAHGAIAPGHVLLTRAGQVVLLDPIYGGALERLHFTRARLWREFGLAMPPAAGPARFNEDADVAQAALIAVMLVLGRPLRFEEYPAALPTLLSDVVEIAQIRGSGVFASALHRFLQRALPLSGRQPFASADEAHDQVREIVAAEMGVAACHQALVAFIEEMARPRPPRPIVPQAPRQPLAVAPADAARPAEPRRAAPRPIAAAPPAARPREEPAPVAAPVEPMPAAPAAPPPAPAPAVAEVAAPVPPARVAVPVEPAAAEPAALPPIAASPAPVLAALPPPAPIQAAASSDEPRAPKAEPASEEPAMKDSPRRKSERSARSKRDRLRSIAGGSRSIKPVVEGLPPAPQPVFPVPYGPGTAGAIEPPSPYQGAQGWQPTPAGPPLAPIAAPAAVAPPIALQAPVAVQPPAVSAGAAPLRIKKEPPPGFRPRKEPRRMDDPDTYPLRGTTTRQAGGGFPWKVAAAAVIVLAIGATAGRQYLPQRTTAATSASGAAQPVRAVEPPPPAVALTGTVVLTSDPAGAQVLLDGKPAGETPVTLEGVKPGRRVLTISSVGGSVKRTIRVEAGKSVTLDVPIFSGWVAISSPIVLEVAENGRAIGTTDQGRLLLSPGRHVITVANRDLEYSSVHVVEIEPGQDRRLTIEPRAPVSLNAQPWAEVWIDGKRAGETPLANLQIPLGTREIVFKHPQYGERRMTTTIKASSPTAITVDLTKPANP